MSYVESDESEDVDESMKKKSQKVHSFNIPTLNSCICFSFLAVKEILSQVPLLDFLF